MLELAGLQFTPQVRQKGAIIVVRSDWECNLDGGGAGNCDPHTSFELLGASYNFRRAEYREGLLSTRQLIKMYGLRIVIIIVGSGGKFDLAALLTNIGAGIGLLAVASLVADFAAVNLLGAKDLYERAKFRQVEVNDDEVDGRVVTRGIDHQDCAPVVLSRSPTGIPARTTTPGLSRPVSLRHGGTFATPPPFPTVGGGVVDEEDIELQNVQPQYPSGAVGAGNGAVLAPSRVMDDYEQEESWARRQ
jgi:hypothetical protein